MKQMCLHESLKPSTASRLGQIKFIRLAGFFLSHTKDAFFDAKKVCMDLFEVYFTQAFDDPLFVYHIFDLVKKHHVALTEYGIISTYLPLIFKAATYHIASMEKPIVAILPFLLSSETMIETLHIILDMSLVSKLLDTSERSTRDNIEIFASLLLRSHSNKNQFNVLGYYSIPIYISLASSCFPSLAPTTFEHPRRTLLCGSASMKLISKYVDIVCSTKSALEQAMVLETLFFRFVHLFGPGLFKYQLRVIILEKTRFLLANNDALASYIKPCMLKMFQVTPDFRNAVSIDLLGHCYYLVAELFKHGNGDADMFRAIVLQLHSLLYNELTNFYSAQHCRRFALQLISTLTAIATINPLLTLEAQCSLNEIKLFTQRNPSVVVDSVINDRLEQAMSMLLNAASIRKVRIRYGPQSSFKIDG